MDIPNPRKRDPFTRMNILASHPTTVIPKLPEKVQIAVNQIRNIDPASAKSLFSIDAKVRFLNHGSFGAVPTYVQMVQRAWMDVIEQEPVDAIVDFDPFIAFALRELSHFIRCNPQDLVFVDNATSGINTILKSLGLGTNDTILTISFAYPAVTSTIAYMHNVHGVRVHELKLDLPTSKTIVMNQFAEYLQCAKPTIAVIDHITSSTGLVLPVLELVNLCHQNGVLVLIDGAHAVGQVDIDLNHMNPDFYVTNCHKWLFAPRGCAIMYVKQRWQTRIHPLSTSTSYGKGFQAEFLWTGTRDISVPVSAVAGLAFYKHVNRSVERNQQLLMRTALFLQKVTNGQLLTTDHTMLAMLATLQLPKIRTSCILNTVTPNVWKHRATYRKSIDPGLPISIEFNDMLQPGNVSLITLAEALHDTLRLKYGIEVWCSVVAGEVVVRISVQVYNNPDEYVSLARALVEIQDGPDHFRQFDLLVSQYLSDTKKYVGGSPFPSKL